MGMFHKVKVGNQVISPIDWEMNPDLSFGTFESWGGRERVRNNGEFVYYFFVDNWGPEPKLCLMERAVKHAKILAEIKAPPEIVRKCVKDQGVSSIFEKSYAINEQLKAWLIDHVLDETGDSSLVVPRQEKIAREDMGPPLPAMSLRPYKGEALALPAGPAVINDDEIAGVIKRWNFFEAELNPTGRFDNVLAAGAPGTIVDQRTSLMWQQDGIDIGSLRHIQKKIEELNRREFAGFGDWRLPTMEEAMSLMEPDRNAKGLYLHPVFSREQPFIFVAAQRRPGGYWFVDYKQGRAFWSSGTIPGGFGRLVRTMSR